MTIIRAAARDLLLWVTSLIGVAILIAAVFIAADVLLVFVTAVAPVWRITRRRAARRIAAGGRRGGEVTGW